MQAFIEVVKTWNGFEDYIPKLISFCENLGELGRKCYRANEKQGYNVLNHGDFHLRNLLARNNQENRLESFRVVRTCESFMIKATICFQFSDRFPALLLG
jgi:hypothetical protein